jgi:predicted metal-dependent hydrolase
MLKLIYRITKKEELNLMTIKAYPEPYIQYLAEYFGSRDFFECHEVMEEYWKAQPNSRYTGCWLVFIRISVACYHARRGNWVGARKMINRAAEEVDPTLMSELGMDGQELARILVNTKTDWYLSEEPNYQDLDLPIQDEQLLECCQQYCSARGWSWGKPLAEMADDLVHKHLRRDRSEVVETRRLSALLKSRKSKEDELPNLQN